jgi:hypothetical protein
MRARLVENSHVRTNSLFASGAAGALGRVVALAGCTRQRLRLVREGRVAPLVRAWQKF